MKFLLCFSPTDTSCSNRALVHRLYCQGRGRVTPWHRGLCTPLHPGLSLAAAWPDHCLPSTSLTAAATGSAQPYLHHYLLSPWPCCSHTSSVSYRTHQPSCMQVCQVQLHKKSCFFFLFFFLLLLILFKESTFSKQTAREARKLEDLSRDCLVNSRRNQ